MTSLYEDRRSKSPRDVRLRPLARTRFHAPIIFALGVSVLALFLLSTVTLAFNGTVQRSPSPLKASTIVTTSSGSWSDPKTWGGQLPPAGKDITISPGVAVTYDLPSSPNYGNILVLGSLVFSHTKSTSISFENLTIARGGYVEIGTANSPIPSNVNTVVYLNAAKEGSAGILVMGTLEIHGASIGRTFTKLAANAPKGSTSLTVSDVLAWHTGDHVVITSTSLLTDETEENSIAGISGNHIILAKPLNFSHDGIAPSQGEVADLTRNVVATSLNPGVHGMGIMFMYGAKGGISYAEFSHLGAEKVLGKYPIHFHHVQDSMPGTVVDGVSVWDSHNRFITIHNTNSVTVKNTVGFKSIGHGFFLEDATEQKNTLVNNIAILTLPGEIRPDDGGASGFWVQNPRNNLTNNIAVSAYGSGFDYAIPDKAPEVIPFDLGNFQASLLQKTTPTNLSITAFVGNEAHSNGGDGLFLYRLDPSDAYYVNVFANLKMWRNDGLGIELTASPALITSSLLFGNQWGNIQIDTSDTTIRNVRAIGELPGMSTLMNATNPGTERYMVSPFGLLFSATNLTIQDSVFTGHRVSGTYASADVISQPDHGVSSMFVLISNTYLLSQHRIVFGYPLSGDSYIKVVNLNGDPAQSFILYRYDTNYGPSCSIYIDYMALKCSLAKDK